MEDLDFPAVLQFCNIIRAGKKVKIHLPTRLEAEWCSAQRLAQQAAYSLALDVGRLLRRRH